MKLEPRKIELNTELSNDFIADVGISNMMQGFRLRLRWHKTLIHKKNL